MRLKEMKYFQSQPLRIYLQQRRLSKHDPLISGIINLTDMFDDPYPLIFVLRKWRLQPLRPTPLQASLTAELTGSAYTSRVILSGRSHRGARGGDGGEGGGVGAADLWPCLVLAHATGVGIITRAAAMATKMHLRTIIHRCEIGHFYAAEYFHMALSSSTSHSQDWRPHYSAFGVIRPSLRDYFRESPSTESRFEVQIWGDLSFRAFSALNRINW